MDGILVDTESIMAKSVMLALAEQGINFAEQDYCDNWTSEEKASLTSLKARTLYLM